MRTGLAWLAALSAALLMLPTAVRAATASDDFLLRNTGDLVALCSADQSDPMMPEALAFCQGFGVGVYHTLAKTQAGMTTKLFCPPSPPPTRSQAMASFVAWVKANPNVASEAPADGILDYLAHTYPCMGAGR